MKSEIEKIVENLRVNNIYKNSERGNNYEVEKVEWKKSVNWNHTNSINVDPNHTDSNQMNPADLTNIG